MPSPESQTKHELANGFAARYRHYRGWAGLIHLQRERRIGQEIMRLYERKAELERIDPAHYFDGDWDEVYDGLLHWNTRDPFDEAQWVHPATNPRTGDWDAYTG